FKRVLQGSDLEQAGKRPPAEDICAERAHISWADVITFIFPLWWAGMPAIAKGYLDRVFSEGFAYRFDDKGHHRLLKSKKVLTITTIGDTEENYRTKGFFSAMDKLMDEITFDFSGLQVIGHRYFCSVPFVSDAERKKMLQEIRQIAQELEQPSPIPAVRIG
ncbi:MAG: NAD(P)H-dependent oxidoreductase, partial [Pseudomonadota bacterium]